MQEHFNENYMESEKYPNASFKGTIEIPTLVFNKIAEEVDVTLQSDVIKM